MEASEGICVGIRMRPLNERELASGQQMLFQCMASANAVAQMREGAPVEGQVYYFDKVFDEKSSTADVYSHIGKNIVQGVMNGINGTIFAYGQTSSGKTHTMLGGGDQKGVLNMAAEDIFNFIAEHPNRDFLLRASFVEIYNENIRDLLSDSADATVAIREDPRKGVYCEALECMITDFDSITRLLRKGAMKRTVEATAMNETSSRSHTIFKLVVESRESNRDGRVTDGAVLVAALNLVDLAGSESVRHTGAMGQRAKEGGKINQSLLSLSRVIHSLSQPGAHVNFRDSKLTRLLQPSLSGNARMSIVCCVTPADRYLEETRSTLQFASRAKLVVTHATVNEVVDEAAQIRRLKQEIEVLKAQQKGDFSSIEELTRLESEKLDLLQQLDLKCDQEAKLSVCLDEMEQSNSYFRSEIERYQSETEELKNKLLMMEEIAAAKNYYEQQVNELKLSMEEQVVTLNDQLLSLKTEVEAYEEKVSSMGMALLDKDDKIEQLEQDLYSAASAEEKATQLQEKFDDLQASFSAQEALFASEKKMFDAQLQEMRTEKDTILEEMNTMKEEIESYTIASEEKMTLLQQELVELQVQLQAKDEEFSAARDSELQQLQEQVQQLNYAKESMTKEIKIFEGKVSAQEKENVLLMQEKESFSAANESFQAKLNQKQLEIDELIAAKDAVENNFSQLEREMNTFKIQMALYLSRIEELQALNTQLSEEKQANNTVVSEDLLQKDLLLQELQLKMDDLQATFTAQEALFESEKEEFAAQLQEMEALKAISEEKTKALEVEIVQLQEKLQEMEAMKAMNNEEEVDRLYIEIEQLQSIVTELSVEKSCLSEQIFSLQDNIAKQEDFNHSKEEQLQKMIQGKEILEEKHQEAIARMEEMLLTMQSTKEEMTATIEQLQSIVTELSVEKSCLSEQIFSLQDNIAKQEDFNHSKEEQLQKMIQGKEMLEEKHQEAIARMEEMLLTIEQLQEKLVESTSFTQELEMQIEELKLMGETAVLEKEELQQQLGALKMTMETSSANSETLQSELNEMKMAQEEVLAKKDEELSVANEKLAVLSQQIDACNAQITELMTDKNTLVEDLAAKSEEITSLTTQVADSKTFFLEKEELAQELATLKVTMEEKEIEQNVMRLAQEEELLKKNEEMSLLNEEMSLANETIAEMSQQIENLTSLITSLTTEKDHLEALIVKKEDEIASFSAQIEQHHQSNITLSRISEIEITSKKIEEARRDLQRQLETRQVEMGKLENELKFAWQEKNELLIRVNAAEETVAQYNLEFASVNDTDSQNKKKVLQLQTQVDLLLGEKDMLSSKLKMMENEHKTTLNGAVRYAEGLEKQHQELNVKMENDEGQLLRFQEALKASEQHIMFLKQEKDESKERLSCLQEEMKQLQETYNTIYEECVALRESNNNLDYVKELQEEIALLQARYSETQEVTNRFKKAKEDANMWQLEYQRTVSQLDIIAQEKQQLAQALEIALEDVQKLTVALNETSALLSAPASPLPAKNNNEVYLEEIAMLKERVADLEMHLSETHLQLTATQKANESVTQDLQEKCVALEEELSHLRETVTQLENEVGETQAAYDTLFCNTVTLREQYADLTNRNSQLQQHNAETTGYKETIEQLNQAKLALEDEISTLHQEKTQTNAEIIELVAKIGDLETQIAEFDHVAAKEQATLMDAAEVQLQLLRNEIETLSSSYTQSQIDLAAQKSQVVSLQETITQLEATLNEANDTIIELEATLAMNNSKMRNNNEENGTKDEEIASLKVQFAAAETQIASLKETLVQKDARIQHLDACKLTKDQMEKIKVMKEERKKYQEDAKNLKRQLLQLKQTYDELKSSMTTRVAAPTQEFVISDLKFQVAEMNTQLQNSQNLVTLLKEKLKECSQQLEEYEKERNDVLMVLEKQGVDVSSLLLNNNNNDDHNSNNNLMDLADAVNVLAEKLVTTMTQLQLQHHQRQQHVQDTETRLRENVAENEENKAQKLALERRLDQMKTSLRNTREELAALTVEKDNLLEQVASLTEELKNAEKKAVSSCEFASSEVQVLEEENIELMRENKELRIEITRLKASTVSAPPCSATKTQKKNTRAFGVEIDVNVASQKPVEESTDKKTPKRSISEVGSENNNDENQVPGVTASGMKRLKMEQHEMVSSDANKIVRKVKAKPLTANVAANNNKNAVNTSVSAGGEEMPGECAQS